MRWEDERYVRVYTRDTAELVALGWEARALMWEIMRKCDRAGILKLGRTGARGLAGLTGIPPEVVARALPLLVADGCVIETDNGIVIPNFLEAQETPHSGPMRQREWRARNRDVARRDEMSRSRDETFHERDETSPKRDGARRDVTRARRDETARDSMLCRSVPFRAVPEITRALDEPTVPPIAGGSDPPDPTGADGTGGASPPDPVALGQEPGQGTLSDLGRAAAPSPPSEGQDGAFLTARRTRSRSRGKRSAETEQSPAHGAANGPNGDRPPRARPMIVASTAEQASPAICLHCGKPTSPRLQGRPHKTCADREAQRLAREKAGGATPERWAETVDAYFVAFAAANAGEKPVFGPAEGAALKRFIGSVGATRAQQIIKAAFAHPWWKDKSLTLLTILRDPSKFIAGNRGRESSMLQQPAKSPASQWKEAEPLRLPDGPDPWDLKGPTQ